ncbi:MAG TPA: amidohydrolase family protein, partial [Gemmataceae bacterium]|nr:amidohydrolase family protein [Gemmataceae bacterium]
MPSPQPPCWTLTARWVFPVDGPPLERGTVTVRGERISAVEPCGRLRADLDLGNAAILPGLVNAHTHLDLTGLRGKCPPTADFTAWLRGVVRHRRQLTPAQVESDIRAGLAESLAHGTTLLGDIAAEGLSWPVLAAAPLRAVVFYELLGLPPARARQAWAGACAWLADHPPTATCRPGLSPHAPYSVHRALYCLAARRARTHNLPLTTHLAETPPELELLAHRRGSLVEFLSELGVWYPDGLASSPGQVLRLCRQATLFAHGNYLDAGAAVPRSGTIVYCPRTHAAFGHRAHPFRAFLAAGVRVALGTDSLASNLDLDVLAEARFLHVLYPDVPGEAVLRMATLSGAEALGWQAETGSLAPGKSADLMVLPLPAEDRSDPYRLVFGSSLPVRAVLCRG